MVRLKVTMFVDVTNDVFTEMANNTGTLSIIDDVNEMLNGRKPHYVWTVVDHEDADVEEVE